MKTELTQNDVYTPAEANAFHEGFEEATITRFSETGAFISAKSELATPAEVKAFSEGAAAGEATFGGIVYSQPSAE